MMAIRSRDERHARTERSQSPSDCASSRSCRGGPSTGPVTGTARASAVELPTGCARCRAVRAATAGEWCRGTRVPGHATGSGWFPRRIGGVVSHPSSAASSSTSSWVGPTNVPPRSTGARRSSSCSERPPTRSRPSRTRTSYPSRANSRAAVRPGETRADHDHVRGGQRITCGHRSSQPVELRPG